MPNVGVKELKNRATEILRVVREEQAQYVVTYHGRPVAVLLPIDEAWLETEEGRMAGAMRPDADLLAELEALRAEIEENWSSDQSAVELVRKGRR